MAHVRSTSIGPKGRTSKIIEGQRRTEGILEASAFARFPFSVSRVLSRAVFHPSNDKSLSHALPSLGGASASRP